MAVYYNNMPHTEEHFRRLNRDQDLYLIIALVVLVLLIKLITKVVSWDDIAIAWRFIQSLH